MNTTVRLWIILYAALCAAFSVRASELAPPTLPISSDAAAAVLDRTRAAAPDLFQRVVLLGASVSAGFTGSEPFGGPKTAQYRFKNFIEAALGGSHEPVIAHADCFVFTNPITIMERQVAATVAARPTLVVALDALFWFCYGHGMNGEQRQERFNAGLRLLELIDTPLVIGDIPDASNGVGRILAKTQMPELSTIAACNARLREWAASRKNITVFPLSEVMLKACANDELSLAGIHWPKGKTSALLQQDALHPSQHGLAGLAIAALEAAGSSAGLVELTRGVVRDPDAVYKAALALASAPARGAEGNFEPPPSE